MSQIDRRTTAHWEVYVRGIVEQVLRRHPVEDSRVELKSNETDPMKAARRLGGLLNAARTSGFVVWILGVDEKAARVVPLEALDLANWLAQVKARFDEVSPELLLDLVVSVSDTESVRALFFDATRAPYVIKTAPEATATKGCPEREVPWREGTSVRVAKRRDLLRILEPISSIPASEVRRCVLSGETVNGRFNGQIEANLYLVPSTRERVVIPFHRCEVDAVGNEVIASSGEVRLLAPNLPTTGSHSVAPVSLVSATFSEMILDGPGLVIVRAAMTGQVSAKPEMVQVSIRLGLADGSQLSQRCDLRFTAGSLGRDTWTWGKG